MEPQARSRQPQVDEQVVSFTREELEGMLQRLEGAVPPEDAVRWRAVATAILRAQDLRDSDKLSLRRFAAMIFGAKTEKTRRVLPKGKPGQESTPPTEQDRRNKKKGHGRNGADDYPAAERFWVSHQARKAGDKCPDCSGTLCPVKEHGKEIRFFGGAPLTAKIWEFEKLRCNACMTIYTAAAPEEAQGPKYDPSAVATIATLKYWGGMPWNRLEDLQAALGVPLSSSTQWDLMRGLYGDCAEAVFDRLLTEAATSNLFTIDDTGARVLGPLSDNVLGRKGLNTTGIIAERNERLIGLYFSGWRHAGENLDRILARRPSGLDVPLQMSDALSRNRPKIGDTLRGSSLAHARRRFVELASSHPRHCRHVLKLIGVAYHVDEMAKRRGLSLDERLALHQTRSGPAMEKLWRWLIKMKARRFFSPHSALGEAIQYVLNQWQRLTMFLRVPGFPLDSNAVERALKVAIRLRRSALYYRTEQGAKVGDCLMSILYTCRLNDVNPLRYLAAIQANAAAVCADPGRWLPWAYVQALQQANAIE